MWGQHAEAPEPDRDRDDCRWAGRLDGIESREAFANPAKPVIFAVTRLLLEAGLQLRDENLARGDGGSTHGMGRVTRRTVVDCAKKLKEQRHVLLDPRVKSLKGAFNQRWPQVDGFRRDVIIFELYTRWWRKELEDSRRRMLALVDDLASGRLGGAAFIRAAVRQDAEVRSRFLRYAVELVGLAMEPKYRDVAIQAHADLQAEHRDQWVVAYHAIQERLGLNLRPDRTVDKAFTFIVWLARSAAVEARVTDRETVDLVAEAVMTMITGLVDPGDHRSCEELVDLMFSTGTDDEDG